MRSIILKLCIEWILRNIFLPFHILFCRKIFEKEQLCAGGQLGFDSCQASCNFRMFIDMFINLLIWLPPLVFFLHNSKSICSEAVNIFWVWIFLNADPFRSKTGLIYINGLSPTSGTLLQCLNDYLLLKQTKSSFWPPFICQILIIFSFLESLWRKKADCKKIFKLFACF